MVFLGLALLLMLFVLGIMFLMALGRDDQGNGDD
jgi:hypothetical protein